MPFHTSKITYSVVTRLPYPRLILPHRSVLFAYHDPLSLWFGVSILEIKLNVTFESHTLRV